MTKQQAIDYFGSQTKLAKATSRSRGTVSCWEERLPRGVQFELQVITKGELRVDKDLLESHLAA